MRQRDGGTARATEGKLTDAAKVNRRLDAASDTFADDTMWLVAPLRALETAHDTIGYEDMWRGPSGAACDLLWVGVTWPSRERLMRQRRFVCVDQTSHLIVVSHARLGMRIFGEHNPEWLWSE